MTALGAWVAKFAVSEGKAGRLLDVGCGTKPYASLFPSWEFVGIDLQVSGRPADGKRVDAWFDGLTIPYEDQSFDAVLCTEVLEHAADPDRLAAEMWRVLRPERRLLVTVPFIWGEHETPFDFRRYSGEGIRGLLERAGFEILDLERSQEGIDAIEALVASEMRSSELRRPLRPGFRKRVADAVETTLWRMTTALWRRRYSFDRIYIDNLVLAMRPARPEPSAKMDA